MFHVKHFCPVRPQNLTRPHTSGGLEADAMARKLDTFGGSLVAADAAVGFERELTIERLLALDPTRLRSAPCLMCSSGVFAPLDVKREPE